MKRMFVLLAALVALTTQTFAATEQPAPKECALCSGVVYTAAVVPASTIPLLIEVQDSTITPEVTALSPQIRERSTLLATLVFDQSADVAQVESRITSLVEAAKAAGPFQTLAVDLKGLSPELQAYAAKRLAVATQGRAVANESAMRFTTLENAEAFAATGAQSYVDAWIVDDNTIATAAKWLEQRDPGKKLIEVLAPTHINALYDVGSGLASGARTVFLRTDENATLDASLAAFNREFAGDFTFDPTSGAQLLDALGNVREEKPLAFVRGEDLRTLLVTPGNSSEATIVSVAADDGMSPRRVDATSAKQITDTGKKARRLLIGVQPSTNPYLLTFDRPPIDTGKVTKETIDVATRRGLSVEEIVRNHQAYRDYQETVAPRYIARNATKLRFSVGAGEQIEATLAGDHFFDPAGHNDWVWKDLYINGVKWKYGSIPELPLIQPEKVSQLPLDIHLTHDYHYELVGETKLNGYDAYEVRFEPPKNAPDSLPLYRGTVWIDMRTFARLRISMIQLHLSGEVLSNEESVDFIPFDAVSGANLTPAEVKTRAPRELLWLPVHVTAQQVLSTAGRTTAVVRATDFTNFHLSPSDFSTRLAEAEKSNARMVRDTDAGLRYLERRGDGTRVVKEGFDSSKLFALGGVHHDEGLDYPVVPLGGIDYFNFNVLHRGMQSNVFFAGVVLAANLHKPNFMKTRTNVGGDVFGLAVPVTNTIFRNGEESPSEDVKSVPLLIAGRVGHPVFGFGKIDLSVGVSHLTYQRGEDTASDFRIPSDTFEVIPGVDFRYERHGYLFGLGAERGMRTSWDAWGVASEFDPKQKNFERWQAVLGKSFYLPKFQRLSMEVDYLDGRNLDRFSKYELGFFGSQRVRGVRSGSVRAEQAILGHFSYGFVVSDQIRLEAFYDHALIDDATAGYQREPFQGVGVAGQLIGPFGTLLRLDIGKTVGRNAQDNFVADVVFLKIFR